MSADSLEKEDRIFFNFIDLLSVREQVMSRNHLQQTSDLLMSQVYPAGLLYEVLFSHRSKKKTLINILRLKR